MTERDLLVSALASEVLGPRGGMRERLEAAPHQQGATISPIDEYVTGVLVPSDSPQVIEVDADDDLLGEDSAGADDQADSGAPAVPAVPSATGGPGRSPSLDPRSRPCSIGLSVMIAGERPHIDVCATWAWYDRSGAAAWLREPRHSLWRNVDCTVQRQSRVIQEGDGVRAVSLEVRVRLVGSLWRVSLFLVNVTRIPGGSRPQSEHHVFQPQIRIRTPDGASLAPMDEGARTGDSEEDSLALLYAGRRAYARGHLCAAMWKGIDPEAPAPGDRPQSPPFYWEDGALLPAGSAAEFSPADARTELVPCYQISAPALNAAARHGDAVFDPERLSSIWDAQELGRALSPMTDAYERWIEEEERRARGLHAQHQAAARAHLTACSEILRRIREGIAVLCADEDARLAFCFANKAIAVQSRWRRGAVDPWRPFQLAFQLINIPAIRDERSPERSICDLLWIPTGGGKTEAYLGLAAFTLALRRLLAQRSGQAHGGAGVSVLSRYTLRLLTIQQFRRALALVTACERLRSTAAAGVSGWRPLSCPERADHLWGRQRFSIGLWVGGEITPNGLFDFSFQLPNRQIRDVFGALSILEGRQGDGEPAQVLECPCCREVLAVPPEGFRGGEECRLSYVLECANPVTPTPGPAAFSGPPLPAIVGHPPPGPLLAVGSISVFPHRAAGFYTLTLSFVPARDVKPQEIDRWCESIVLPAFGGRRNRLASARGSRPGYFLRQAAFRGGNLNPVDFEIICPNPECELSTGDPWSELAPEGPVEPMAAFALTPTTSSRVPIPALTVDDQIYHRCPSMVVATVDKFARLAFEPRAASLFGIVDHYCGRHGYYRAGCPPTRSLPPRPADHPPGVNPIPVSPFLPPDLILQDELHLIEGPLGSMVGLYETAIDALSCRPATRRAKYVASSATVRKAGDQIQSLYDRNLSQFPPSGLSVEDNFFTQGRECHALDSSHAGRLYVGICAPGRGAQTPIVRVWSRLLQQVQERLRAGAAPHELDPYWTLVGYFNAIRELAGAVALIHQDIPERMGFMWPAPRPIPEDNPMELSSRADSLELPGLLERLGIRLPAAGTVDSVVATSMFGTGVDVSRLGLMVVHGQPKTSSTYIQATGRVGRERGGLVVTFYRASRPRDLSHFEFFLGYHRELYRHVEPVTVNPFSPRARDRALGPVAVALLRQATQITGVALQFPWRVQQKHGGGWLCNADDMARAQGQPEVGALGPLFETRAQAQPAGRRPPQNVVNGELISEITVWAQLAAQARGNLLYNEPTMINPPTRPVVLGDLTHEALNLPVAFENAPTSLREVEPTTTFKGR